MQTKSMKIALKQNDRIQKPSFLSLPPPPSGNGAQPKKINMETNADFLLCIRIVTPKFNMYPKLD